MLSSGQVHGSSLLMSKQHWRSSSIQPQKHRFWRFPQTSLSSAATEEEEEEEGRVSARGSKDLIVPPDDDDAVTRTARPRRIADLSIVAAEKFVRSRKGGLSGYNSSIQGLINFHTLGMRTGGEGALTNTYGQTGLSTFASPRRAVASLIHRPSSAPR